MVTAYDEAQDIGVLVGQTFVSVVRRDDAIEFVGGDGRVQYVLGHSRICCEAVDIEDIAGDLTDLEAVPILAAARVTNSEIPARPGEYTEYSEPDSYTWTFFRITTIKGTVVIRFYGESNGYYSEDAYLYKVAA